MHRAPQAPTDLRSAPRSATAPRIAAHERGFSLVETMCSLGIFFAGLGGLVAMQLMTIKSVALANEVSLATNLVTSKLDDLELASYDDLADGSETYDKLGNLAEPGYFTIAWTTSGGELADVQVTCSWLYGGTEPHTISMNSKLAR